MSSIKSLVKFEVLDRISQFDNSISVQHDIHPEMNLDYNSILLVIGKTFNIGNEVATLKYLDHDFVQILYVTNNPNDLTLMKLKDLIEVPIRFISYDESGDCIQELRQYTQAYNEIIEKGLIQQLTDDFKQDMLQFFHLKDFVQKPFYNIIIYDDAMNIFKKPTSPEFKMLFEYRHFRTTYFLMLQSIKGRPTEIKAQIGGLWLFGGFNRQQFTYMATQICFPFDKEIVWNIYRQLSKNDFLYIHYAQDEIKIFIIDVNGRKTRVLTEDWTHFINQ